MRPAGMPNVQRVPRSHTRYPIPFSAGVIVVEIASTGGEQGDELLYAATLWDITRQGCCALVQGHPDALVGHRCQLTIRDAQSPEVVGVEATMQWCDHQMHNSFCGFWFLGTEGLPTGTFLESFLQKHWTE